jgi:pilus assembly protein CpaF
MWNKFTQKAPIKIHAAPADVEVKQNSSVCPLTYFDDEDINEILLDGCRTMWLLSAAGRSRLPSPFPNDQTINQWILGIARATNVRLDPIVGAAGGVLQDGALRWHCLLAPMAIDGPIVSIRRHRFSSLSLDDFSITKEDLARLTGAISKRDHLIIAGPTGSGKTSLLAALIKMVPTEERVFLLESVPEIGALTPGVVRFATRQANIEQLGAFGLERLLAESLRLLPDRLVVGEVRSSEASVLIEAFRAGHAGVMSTIHASSAKEVLNRLTSLANLSASAWAKDLSQPVLVVSMERGTPPKVLNIEPL